MAFARVSGRPPVPSPTSGKTTPTMLSFAFSGKNRKWFALIDFRRARGFLFPPAASGLPRALLRKHPRLITRLEGFASERCVMKWKAFEQFADAARATCEQERLRRRLARES